MTTWEDEAIRLHRRYQVEVVEAYGLCPWAASARLCERTREHVLLQQAPDVAETLRAIDSIAADADIEVAFLIFPRLEATRAAFNDFVARTRDAAARGRTLEVQPYVYAAFHPDASADLARPDKLVPFLRRTPDPTIQLLRSDLVVRDGTRCMDVHAAVAMMCSPPQRVRDRIADQNLATVQRVGVATLEALFDDIRRERERSYRELARRGGVR